MGELSKAMSILAHFHNAEGHDIGYICGASIPDKKGWRIIRHVRGCCRHGQPFIRIAKNEISSLYACYACQRVYSVTADWGDGIDGVRLLSMPPDWWGWRHAQANEITQLQTAPLWVQECGRGLAHWQYSFGFRCGRKDMVCAMTTSGPGKQCQRCAKRAT